METYKSIIIGNTDLSINRIEEFMETLEDLDLLNDKGIKVRNDLWRKYIYKKD